MRGVALALGSGIALTLALVLVLGGCGGDAQSDAFAICDRICGCRFDLPAQRDGCFDQCMDDVPAGLELGTECVECFEAASCVALDACLPTCGVADDPPVEGR